ncbi:hypothetical protein SLEP1_g47994 [Rubroshorea leprosula]|uniref:Uncharacterized protein n=1 Tax=Rubroshorea leprosula TaxID=152421 RepID=A0AAV5LT65_9ROSI|nr:hypothetical protein SLEP1_g47994 [Rubroshorea leprosula]
MTSARKPKTLIFAPEPCAATRIPRSGFLIPIRTSRFGFHQLVS